MNFFSSSIHLVFPLLTLLLLLIGFKTRQRNYVLVALWLSIIALFLHYQTANGEILGSYFDYTQAAIYSVNLLVLVISILYFIWHLIVNASTKMLRFCARIFSILFVAGAALLLYNIWFNAYFLSDRMPNTPILQVATFKRLAYCNYDYVFYKVSSSGQISYLCPNRYLLLPSQGNLDTAPLFVIKQLPKPLQDKYKQVKSETNS